MSKLPRVGIVNEYFPPFAVGGAEWSSLQLAETLVERGHEVSVITPDYGGSGGREVRGNLSIFRYALPSWMRRPVPVNSLWHGNPWFYMHMASQIAAVARAEQLDVLHAQNKYSVPAVALAGQRLGLPTVATVRDYVNLCPTGTCLQRGGAPPKLTDIAHFERCFWRFYRQYDGRSSAISKLRRWTRFMVWESADMVLRRISLNRMDKIVAVSKATADLHVAAGIPSDRLQVVYNVPPPSHSTDVAAGHEFANRFEIGNRRIVAVVGKLSIGKGTPQLLDAARQTIRAVPETVFVLAGRTELAIDIPHDLVSSIIIPGVISQADVRSLYGCASVVALPSIWPEPFSRVLLEAMTAGLPIVGTRVGGTPEAVVSGETGWLVPPGNSNALARALISLLRAPALANFMGARGRERVQTTFHPDVSYQRLLNVYLDVFASNA